ncbi:unnamed protein product [Enterobius vermicularis]|uniref:F-box/LRR-repeat protein n=1 Tax=Enterobius vermicularis TaxID=51028 RepID=A0A0N4VBU8_ENTVE|nr:unnamed protein product [Enterobius vermicularis]
MRKYFINEEELQAVRNWTGILREKTLFDAAISRASYLKVLDLGTMVAEGSFGSWVLKDLFKKLENLTELTWLNCHLDGDDCALLELKNVEKLKRLVLHITKFDRKNFLQFFDRFGWTADDEAYETVLYLVYKDCMWLSFSLNVGFALQFDDSELKPLWLKAFSTLLDRDVPFVDGSNDYDAEEYDTDESMVDGRNEEELMNERDEASRGSISVESIHGVAKEPMSSCSSELINSSGKDYHAIFDLV